VGDGEGTEEETEGDQHPPHLRSPPNFSAVVASVCARDFAVFCAVVWNSLPTDLRVLSLTAAAAFAKHL